MSKSKLQLLISSLFLLGIFAFQQANISSNAEQKAHKTYEKAKEFEFNQLYDSALVYMIEAQKLYSTSGKNQNKNALHQAILELNTLSQQYKGFETEKKFMQHQRQRILDDQLQENVQVWGRWQYYHLDFLFRYDSKIAKDSLEYYKQNSIKYCQEQQHWLQLIDNYLLISQYHYQQEELDSAANYIQRLETLIEEDNKLSFPANYYIEKSNICLVLKDYPCALDYSQIAKRNLESQGMINAKDSIIWEDLQISIAKAQAGLENYQEAINIYLEILEYPDPTYSVEAWYELGKTYIQLDQHPASLAAFQKGLALLTSSNFDKEQLKEWKIQYYQYLSLASANVGNLSQSQNYIQQAASLDANSSSIQLDQAIVASLQKNIVKANQIFETLHQKSNTLSTKERLQLYTYWSSLGNNAMQQLKTLQQGLQIISKDSLQIDSVFTVPSIDKLTNPIAALDLILLKIEYLKNAECSSTVLYQHHLLLIEIMDKIIVSSTEDQATWIIEKHLQEVYNSSFELASQLYQETKNQNYLNDKLLLLEKNRLLKNKQLLGIHPSTFFGTYLPDSNLLKLPKLEQRRRLYTAYYYEYARQNDSIHSKIYENYLIDIKAELQEQKDWLQSNYPNYWKHIYSNPSIQYAEIQANLDSEEQILYLFEGVKKLYIYSISKDSITQQSFDYPRDYAESLFTFYQLNNDYAAALANPQRAYQQFSQKAYSIHQNYFQNLVQDSSDLIIIPDGFWWNLPFQSLLSQNPSNEQADFRTLPYWIKKHKISYQYSLNDWLEKRKNAYKAVNNRILAMAPNYLDTNQNMPQAREQLGYLADIYMGYYYQEDKASANRFVEYAPYYGLLHLAAETEYSFSSTTHIKFSVTPDDSSQVYDLDIERIRSLQLKATSFFLQSQQNANPKDQNNLALARSLKHAGVASVIQAQWQANKVVSSSIPTAFYDNLQAGLAKHEALRQAQLAHINQAPSIAAHPAIWANFIQIGDYNPIEISTPISQIWWYILPIVALLVIGWWGLRGLRQRRKF
ncbi:MAG: CHAT domain-containing protein [Saprospiraceae bacterium]|nr:CHAT domain-containing protein [Saprospiraceae bacterium]